jgi:adenosylcobinamide-GDP ribazoletransferase
MTSLVADLRAAVAILTRLPVGAQLDGRAGAAWFPLVGLGIGVVAAIPVALIGAAEPVLAGIAAIALAAIASGGLHLDALADTADALMAPDAERAEAARRDPRVGSGGVIALVLVIGAEVAAITSLIGSAGPVVAAATVIAAAAVARAVPVVLIAPWARRPGSAVPAAGLPGAGAWFASHVRRRDGLVALALAGATSVGLALLTTPIVGLGAGLGMAVGLIVGLAIRAARGRWDGDALGAALELTVLASLVMAVLIDG